MSEPDRIESVEHITDHVSRGLAMFYRQFSDKPKIRALAAAWLTQIQQVEDALWDLLSVTIDNAADDALDQFGRLLKFPRGALVDGDYRAILKAVVRARRSSGTSEDIMQTAAIALGAVTFTYVEGGASEYVATGSPITFAIALLQVLRIAKAGGVQLQVLFPVAAAASTFTLGSGLRLRSSATKGFADTLQTTGGHLAGVVA